MKVAPIPQHLASLKKQQRFTKTLRFLKNKWLTMQLLMLSPVHQPFLRPAAGAAAIAVVQDEEQAAVVDEAKGAAAAAAVAGKLKH